MKRKTIRFTEEQIEEMERAVGKGWYPNFNEAVRAAVREKFQERDGTPQSDGRSLNGARDWKGGQA